MPPSPCGSCHPYRRTIGRAGRARRRPAPAGRGRPAGPGLQPESSLLPARAGRRGAAGRRRRRGRGPWRFWLHSRCLQVPRPWRRALTGGVDGWDMSSLLSLGKQAKSRACATRYALHAVLTLPQRIFPKTRLYVLNFEGSLQSHKVQCVARTDESAQNQEGIKAVCWNAVREGSQLKSKLLLEIRTSYRKDQDFLRCSGECAVQCWRVEVQRGEGVDCGEALTVMLRGGVGCAGQVQSSVQGTGMVVFHGYAHARC